MNKKMQLTGTGLIFLKLGGSLITDKSTPRTPKTNLIRQIAEEIAGVYTQNPGIKLLIGHGSGSFAHVPANIYNTIDGVQSPEEWRGFVEVWQEASSLNRIVVDIFHEYDIPIITFAPSSMGTARNRIVSHWNMEPIQQAINAGLVPMVFGDVVFDEILGGTILSTEDIFTHLAAEFSPDRVLLAGIDSGVYADYPVCEELLPSITPASRAALMQQIQGSGATDVTGGMETKVLQMIDLVQEYPDLIVHIFSGKEPGAIRNALEGNPGGTMIHKS